MGEGHLPVLVDEVLASLALRSGSSIADCTVGGGGHAERLLEAVSRTAASSASMPMRRPSARRPASWPASGSGPSFARTSPASRRSPTRRMVPLDGVLFDLGLSSYQLADARRGFAFTADAPPDMRFDETSGVSALELIDSSSERELARILATLGEERRAGRIAKAIVAARTSGRLVTASDLAAVVAATVPARGPTRDGSTRPPGPSRLCGWRSTTSSRCSRQASPRLSVCSGRADGWSSSATTRSRTAS